MKPFANKKRIWTTALILLSSSPFAFSQTFRGGADLQQYFTELTAAAEAADPEALIAKLESVRFSEPVRIRAFAKVKEIFEDSFQAELTAWIVEDPMRILAYDIKDRMISTLIDRFPREMLGLVKDACPHRAILRNQPRPTDLCSKEAPCDQCIRQIAEETPRFSKALLRETDEEARQSLQTTIDNLGNSCIKRMRRPLAALLAHEGKCHAGCKFCGPVVRGAVASLVLSGEDILPILAPLHGTPLHQEAALTAVESLTEAPAKARALAAMLEEQFPEYRQELAQKLLERGVEAYTDEEIRAMKLGSTIEESVYSNYLLAARLRIDAPEEVIAWINSHEPSRQRDMHYLDLARLWLESDFNAALDWIGTGDHGHLKPNLASTLLYKAEERRRELSSDEFPKILRIAEASGCFQGPSFDASDLRGFFRKWASIDKDACFEAMMKCSALSGSLEERCSQVLVRAPNGQLILDLQGDLNHLRR